MARAIDIRSNSTKIRTAAEEAFLKDARRYNVLTADEESEIVSRIQMGDERAKSELVNANLRFIYSLATKFSQGDDVLDLCSLATIGMYTAMASYDATKGVRFLSYAVHYMREEISEYFATDAQLVRNKMGRIATKANGISEKFFNAEGRYPTEDELVEILESEYNVAIKSRTAVLNHSYNSLSDRKDEDGATAEEVGEIAVATASRNDYEREMDNEDNRYKVAKILAILPERTRTILEMSFGVGDYDTEYEDEAIAEKFGLTAERVRQIKVKALANLKGRATAVLAG